MVTTAGLSCSAMSANDADVAGTTAFIVGVAVTRPSVGAEWAGEGVRLPARTRPIMAPTAIARPMVMAANRLVRWEGIVNKRPPAIIPQPAAGTRPRRAPE